MIFQKCIDPDMFLCIRHYMAEVCALLSALLVEHIVADPGWRDSDPVAGASLTTTVSGNL